MNRKKKVGVVTVFKTQNCGSFFQAWALQKALQKRNVDVYFFDYDYEFNSRKKLWLSVIKCIARLKFQRAKGFIQKAEKFEKLQSCFITVEEQDKVDIAIFGSDTIWNFEDEYFRKNMAFFLGENISLPKYSYAASVGSTSSLLFISEERILNGLSNFDNVSVRDLHSYKVVKSILPQKEITISIDPTMLVDIEEYNCFIEKDIDDCITDRFILLYYFGELPGRIVQSLNTFSQKYNLRILRVGMIEDCEYDTLISTPEAFIFAFKNAEYVFTNTFHGCVFSMLFHRQFLTDGYHKAKVRELLSLFNMEDRYYQESQQFEAEMISEIDYSSFDCHLNEVRLEANRYLDMILKQESVYE